eukprot:RCo000957
MCFFFVFLLSLRKVRMTRIYSGKVWPAESRASPGLLYFTVTFAGKRVSSCLDEFCVCLCVLFLGNRWSEEFRWAREIFAGCATDLSSPLGLFFPSSWLLHCIFVFASPRSRPRLV